jgi:hypothetical protein
VRRPVPSAASLKNRLSWRGRLLQLFIRTQVRTAIVLQHTPTGVEAYGAISHAPYTRKERTAMMNQLYAEVSVVLKKRVAEKLRVAGR